MCNCVYISCAVYLQNGVCALAVVASQEGLRCITEAADGFQTTSFDQICRWQ